MKSLNYPIAISSAILLIALNSCTPNKSGSTLKIGVIGAQTGEAAEDGKLQEQGVRLAVEQINAHKLLHNNLNMNVNFYDSKSDPKTDVTQLNEAISSDNINLFIGDVWSNLTLPMIHTVDQNEAFLFSPWAGSSNLSNCSPYFARNYPTGKFEAESAAEYSVNSLKGKRIAIVYINKDWGNTLEKFYSDRVKKLNSTIVLHEIYESNVTDFNTIISKIKTVNADLIYLGGYQVDMGNFVKQLLQQNVHIPIVANTNFLDHDCLAIAQNAAEGVVVPTPDFDPKNSEEQPGKDFESIYKRKSPNKEPELLVAKAYDAVMIIKDAYNAVGNNPERIAEYIRNLKNYHGASGNYSFTNGDVDVKIILKQIKNGNKINISK